MYLFCVLHFINFTLHADKHQVEILQIPHFQLVVQVSFSLCVETAVNQIRLKWISYYKANSRNNV